MLHGIIGLSFTKYTVLYLLCWGQDRVKQPSIEMTAKQGDPVTLLCNYSTTTTNAYIFWYKQLSNRSPTFILNKYSFSEGITEADINKRFSATLDSTSRRVPLTIQDVVTLSDSALYYCALRVGAQWYKVNVKLYKNSNKFFPFNVKPHHTHNLEFSEYNYTCGNTCVWLLKG
uniref:Ig-like domain-containing protein n=1 Tax=Sinocyclocheilus rhinocerous TaxID=307959 RepID=A0A673JH67_9TELE